VVDAGGDFGSGTGAGSGGGGRLGRLPAEAFKAYAFAIITPDSIGPVAVAVTVAWAGAGADEGVGRFDRDDSRLDAGCCGGCGMGS
jgi:hypothetical protein